MALRYIIIGNPDNRRVRMFQDELIAAAHPRAIEVSYRALLDDPSVLAELPDEPFVVRQDSAGEDFEVERRLLALGYEDAIAAGATTIDPDAIARLEDDRGRILCPRQQHLGFCRLLSRLEAIYAQHPSWRIMSQPSAIAELFDKRATSRRWRGLGVPVAESLDNVQTYEQLRELSRQRGWDAVYVKVSCSSSASCLAIYHPDDHHGADDSLITTIEHTPRAWYNSLRLRRYRGARLREIVTFLLREGAHIERAVPKAILDGARFDLRIVTIAGAPVFTVVRQSRHDITNLHLGGWRGNLAAFEARLPEDTRAAIDTSCRTIARASACSRIGIDVLVERDWTGHRVLEGNAFGDLLPNLERDGVTVYGWQVRAVATPG